MRERHGLAAANSTKPPWATPAQWIVWNRWPDADLRPRLASGLERLGLPAPVTDAQSVAELHVAGDKPEPFRLQAPRQHVARSRRTSRPLPSRVPGRE